MGLFSSLMGQKLLGTATIKFYGEDEASVEYETEITDKNQGENDLMQLFTLYYAKMLFNLNRGEPADQLISYIQEAINNVAAVAEGKVKRVSILSSSQKLIEPKTSGITKKCSGELYEKSNQMRIVQTHMDAGGEQYYSPVSTVMFLQYLIENLSEGTLMLLIFVLGGMNKYYREIGDYSNMRSMTEAPNYGFNFASQIMNS